MTKELPREIIEVIEKLRNSGFDAFAVGGCVRDILRGAEPKDWDIATAATPEEIQKIFPRNFYNNDFGTVTILTGSEKENLREVEVTPYRTDVGYSDARHPDAVKFGVSLKEDLARRDFTINAISMVFETPPNLPLSGEETENCSLPACPVSNVFWCGDKEGREWVLIDPFDGKKDLENKIIRTVGNPDERFSEDALRLMRAVRFAVTLDFKIEPDTFQAIKKNADSLEKVSRERVRDELVKIIMCPQAERGINLLEETGLLKNIIPELREGIGVKQNKHHIYTVYDHNVKSLGFSAKSNDPLHVRLATLLHDVGKPQTKEGEFPDATFYGHDIVGAAMTRRILTRLKFTNKMVQQAAHLVRHHLFNYDIGAVTEAGVRRLLKRVGKENFNDLLKVRMAERLGSGVPKARPYRLRHLEFMVDKVSRDPLSAKMLKINGHDLISELKMEPGPKIGAIVDVLLAEVLENPKKNSREELLARAAELKEEDLISLRSRAQDVISEENKKRENEIKRKYHVQ